jgi:hypothetical protein
MGKTKIAAYNSKLTCAKVNSEIDDNLNIFFFMLRNNKHFFFLNNVFGYKHQVITTPNLLLAMRFLKK